jgi:hypothetical protein
MNLPLAGAIALALCSPALVSSSPAPDYTHRPLVHQVICSLGKGSAFRVGPTKFLSVSHVTNLGGCTIDGVAFKATADPGLDFAVIEVPAQLRRGGGFKINCDGFKPGEWVYATGYAYGRPWQQTVTLRVTPQTIGGLQLLWGSPTVIPGMSGGVVMNARGEAVGTINRYSPWAPASLSQPLSETSVCRQR